MSKFKFGGISIEPSAYGSQGSAVLGIRDSGKSYTATELAENLFTAGIPFIAFDPIGIWRWMRVPGKGRGYPIVVAGGKAGDLPLTVASAPEYVRAAMRDGVSLVIDLFDINLSKADWKRIVMSCVRVLLHENSEHGLRHVFIEEAAEFAPQRVGPDQGQVYAEIEKLARMGGNSGFGYTLINQRAEEVNKAVLELCDNMFLHRQKGRNSLTALSKWLDIADVKDHRQITDSLPNLPTGECWAWMEGTDRPVHIHVPPKNSFHPNRREMRDDNIVKTKSAVDVGKFVTSMRSSLGKIEEEAKANDPVALRKRIAELERANPGANVLEVKSAMEDGYERGWKEAREESFKIVRELQERTTAALADAFDHHSLEFRAPIKTAPATLIKMHGKGTVTQSYPVPTEPAQSGTVGNSGMRRMLIALAQYPEGMSQRRMSMLTGLSMKSGTWATYLSKMRTNGWIDGSSHIRATESGVAALGFYEPLPTGQALIRYWQGKLGNSGLGRIFTSLTSIYPKTMTQSDLAQAAGISKESGTWSTYLSKLRGLELIDGSAMLKASDDLFK